MVLFGVLHVPTQSVSELSSLTFKSYNYKNNNNNNVLTISANEFIKFLDQ